MIRYARDMPTRTLQVDVTDLAETMDFAVEDGIASFLDLRTGAVVHPATFAERQGDHLVEIPPFDKGHRYNRMVQFAATLDRDQAAVFAVALDGQGAFRRFKNLVVHHGLDDAWRNFQLELDRAHAMRWLAGLDIDVIDVSRRVPVAPAASAGAVVSLVDMLLLGRDEPAGAPGRVRRTLRARSPEQARELFWGLVREICAETGLTVPATTGATGEPEAIDSGRYHLRRRDDGLELEVDVPPGVAERFRA